MADIVKNDKQYVDIAYLKEFWKRIKLLPDKNGTKYTCTIDEKLGVTTNPDTIVGHLESLYNLAADANAKDVVVSDGGVEGKSITVTPTKDGSVTTYTIEIDANYAAAITKAIAAAADAFKGQTTLSADNTDLTAGDVTITLGGDGGDGSTITLSQIDLSDFDDVLHVGEAGIDGGGTITLDSSSQSGTATITGENGSEATVTVDASAIFDAIDELEENAETLDQSNVASTGGSYVTATTTAKTSTSGGELAMTIDDSALDTTFLKKEDAYNEIILINSVTLEKGADNVYAGECTYTANDGGDYTFNISFDSTDFIKDSFLQDAKIGTGDKANFLILTMKLAEPDESGEETKDIEIDLSKFIDAYTAADKSVDITSNKIKVNLDGGYLKLNTNGIGVDTSKLQGYAATEASTGDNNIATKKYVDDKAKDANVSVTATDVTTFGATGTVNIKKGDDDKTGTTFTVTLPSFTAGTQDENVKVSIANDGTISTEVTSQAGDTTHTDKALAQKGYVDQKFDEAKAAVTGGTSTADLITVTTAATTAAPTVSATLTTVTGKTNTAIATKEFVEDSVSNAKVGYESSTLNISESTTDGKTTVTLNAPIATWSDTVANTEFPFN